MPQVIHYPKNPRVTLHPAQRQDVPLLFQLIKDLAEYERLAHMVTGSEALLEQHLFGERRIIEAVIAKLDDSPVGFALYFHNFSTFLTKPGLYLEDLFVKPEARGQGAGEALITYLATIAKERDCGRFEWAVLDWNEPAIQFYRKLGAVSMDDWRLQRVTGDALSDMAARFSTTT
jgi:GNAT superfamily N-acetyltransferase